MITALRTITLIRSWWRAHFGDKFLKLAARRAVQVAIGEEVYAQQLYTAGHKSAWDWCESESVTHHLTGLDVFHHYMNRISQRGWGQFTVISFDGNNDTSDIRLEHSVFS